MDKKQDNSRIIDSQQALRSYVKYVQSKGACEENHQVRVLISKRNSIYNKILEIGIFSENNNSLVIICGNDEFCREFNSKYTNEYQVFEYMSPGVLRIKEAKDRWGNTIEINISFYK